MLTRFWAVLKARNLEFFRDRSSLGWNILFPMLMVVGFAFIFQDEGRPQYKIGVLGEQPSAGIFAYRYVEFVPYENSQKAKLKVEQHGLDLLVEPEAERYWLNTQSPKGYLVEKLLLAEHPHYQALTLSGDALRYLDWVLPGILGMNMMFSCLFGVGYVIVRYRKSSVLKRLKATPLSALEFMLAQVISRLFIVMLISSVVFTACHWIFHFYMLGSFVLLFALASLGAMCMISLGLLMASRSRSEELTGGLLNLVSWPMMVLSGVWFSLEGAPQALQQVAKLLPLTHLLDGARAIMSEGAGLADIQTQLFALMLMTVLFLGLGAWLFRWEGDGR